MGKLRYFHCGEYGDQTQRPHYHAIIYGYMPDDLRIYSQGKRGDSIYQSESLDKLWGLGKTYTGTVTFESASYVARYCLKKISGDMAEDHYKGRQPEYVTMSLKPAIGQGYFDKYEPEIFPSDFVVSRGKKMQPPKFYLKKLETTNPELYKKVKRQRLVRSVQNAENQTTERLAVREEVATAKLNLFQKRTM